MTIEKSNQVLSEFVNASKYQTLLKKEFDLAKEDCVEGGFVPKPDYLKKSKRLKQQLLPEIKNNNASLELNISTRKDIIARFGFTTLESLDYSVKSLVLQQKLSDEGVVFGDKPYNFSLDKLTMPNDTIRSIENTALNGFKNLLTCATSQNGSFNNTEIFLNTLGLKPNSARVDIVLTEGGPKIIEVNCQWVDGIQALQGLRNIFLGVAKPRPSDLVTSQFTNKSKLALVYLNSASGSRASGETTSLQKLANNLVEENSFSQVEIIEPDKIRPEYLATFPSVYIDGDPRMLSESKIPDWVLSLYQNQYIQVFPNWNPAYDKKVILLEASKRCPGMFAKTVKFADRLSEAFNLETPKLVLKGDGFSSRQVAISGTPLYANIWQDAEMFPEDYVLQEKVDSTLIPPTLVFDTSSNTPVLLAKPFCKFNVWIIGNKVAGTMASLSESEIISDKDFNTVPIPC